MNIAFWSVVALLLAAALAFVLPPLWRRQTDAAPASTAPGRTAVYRAQREELDADLQRGTLNAAQHAQAVEDLQRRALVETDEGGSDATVMARAPSRASTMAVALAVPAVALALYGALGAPQAVDATTAAAAPHALTRAQVEVMVDTLAERLKTQPDDAEGWFMLARSQLAFGRFAEAAKAYEQVVRLVPANPELLSDYADTLAQVNGGRLDGRPMELLQAALKIDPAHPKSLALAGTAAYHQRAFDQAIDYWQRLQRTLPADSEQVRSIETSIVQARLETKAAAGATPTSTANATPPAAAKAKAEAAVAGQVSIAPALLPRVGAGDTLFVFARAVDGPRMPLAIVRVPANPAWPFKFTLDDSSAMTPQMKLSGQAQVMLVARLSRSGNAMPQSGDLTGTVGPVAVGKRDVQLVIDSVVP